MSFYVNFITDAIAAKQSLLDDLLFSQGSHYYSILIAEIADYSCISSSIFFSMFSASIKRFHIAKKRMQRVKRGEQQYI